VLCGLLSEMSLDSPNSAPLPNRRIWHCKTQPPLRKQGIELYKSGAVRFPYLYGQVVEPHGSCPAISSLKNRKTYLHW